MFRLPQSIHFRNPALKAAGAAKWFGRGLLNVVLPPHCYLCERLLEADDPSRFCGDCRLKLAPAIWYGCSRCGAAINEHDRRGAGCCHCVDFKLLFDGAIILGAYDGLLRELVLKTKRLDSESASLAAADLLVEGRRKELDAAACDFVLPIPMHWSRRWWRGVNGAEIIASQIARRLGRPLRHGLRRHRRTVRQLDLLPRDRFKNVKNAFRLRPPNAVQWMLRRSWNLKGTRVLLVDDILTTGATCSEAARMLKEAGAGSVVVAVICRAQGKQK